MHLKKSTMSEQTQHIIDIIRAYFAGQPVIKAYLFGSLSRGEENKDSDVDLLVTFDDKQRIGLLKYSSMICDLESRLHRKVDMVEEGTLKPYIAPYVERDKVLIYERA